MENCQEKILDDIVRVDFYDADATTITRSVPFGVPGVIEMNVTQTGGSLQSAADLASAAGEPALSINLAGGSDVQAVMQTPTHKAQPKRDATGDVYQHTLEMPVETGFEAVKQAAYTLSGKEILTVLTAYDGTKLCIHYAPGSTVLTYSDQHGSSHTGTVKYEAQSLSGLVRIAAVSTT